MASPFKAFIFFFIGAFPFFRQLFCSAHLRLQLLCRTGFSFYYCNFFPVVKRNFLFVNPDYSSESLPLWGRCPSSMVNMLIPADHCHCEAHSDAREACDDPSSAGAVAINRVAPSSLLFIESSRLLSLRSQFANWLWQSVSLVPYQLFRFIRVRNHTRKCKVRAKRQTRSLLFILQIPHRHSLFCSVLNLRPRAGADIAADVDHIDLIRHFNFWECAKINE